MDPQISNSIWPLYRHIESYVVTEFLVFVIGLCRSMMFSVVTSFWSIVLDSIAIAFDNFTTEF